MRVNGGERHEVLTQAPLTSGPAAPSVKRSGPWQRRTVEIDRPGARPLNAEEEALLEQFRQKLHARTLQGGLAPEDVQRIVAGIKAHPAASQAVLAAIFEEQAKLAPGQRMLRLDG